MTISQGVEILNHQFSAYDSVIQSKIIFKMGFFMKKYYVYIMTNLSKTLYTGVTSDLERQVYEHKNELLPGFTKRYKMHKLIYFEEFSSSRSAIVREKEIKGWIRKKKVDLVNSSNPEWNDLAKDWFVE